MAITPKRPRSKTAVQNAYDKLRASDTTASRDYTATKQFGKAPDQPWYSSRNAQLNQALKRTAGPSQRFPSAQDRLNNVAQAPDESLAKRGRSAGVPKAKEIARNPYDVGRSPAPKAAEASDLTKKGRSSSPTLSKASANPPAYQGQEGDSPKKRGAVTSYVKDGYTYMKNSQGNYQNFKAGPVPTFKKKDR